MDQFKRKLRLIFVPFLTIALATILIYTFLDWLLIIQLSLIKVDESVPNFIIPFILPWIPLLIWMRPRIKLLKLVVKGKLDPIANILILNWLTIAATLIAAQPYMITATGKLTRLYNIIDIRKFPSTKYYTVKEFYINKNFVHVHKRFAVTDKGSNFNMTIYGAVPVFNRLFPDTTKIAAMQKAMNLKALIIINGKLSNRDSLKKLPADSIRMMRILNPSLVMPMYGDTGKYGAIAVMTKGHKFDGTLPSFKIWPVAWLAVNYSKTINNNQSRAAKEEEFKKFATLSQINFNQLQLGKFVYLDRMKYNRDLIYHTTAIKLKGDVEDTDPIVLTPVFDSFENRNGDKLVWMLSIFSGGSIIFLIVLSLVKLKPNISRQ